MAPSEVLAPVLDPKGTVAFVELAEVNVICEASLGNPAGTHHLAVSNVDPHTLPGAPHFACPSIDAASGQNEECFLISNLSSIEDEQRAGSTIGWDWKRSILLLNISNASSSSGASRASWTLFAAGALDGARLWCAVAHPFTTFILSPQAANISVLCMFLISFSRFDFMPTK